MLDSAEISYVGHNLTDDFHVESAKVKSFKKLTVKAF